MGHNGYDLPPITMNIVKVTRVFKMKLTPFEAGLKETYRFSMVKAGSPANV